MWKRCIEEMHAGDTGRRSERGHLEEERGDKRLETKDRRRRQDTRDGMEESGRMRQHL